jgi:hypothetical protein
MNDTTNDATNDVQSEAKNAGINEVVLTASGEMDIAAKSDDEEYELSIFSDNRDFKDSGLPSYSLDLKINGTRFLGNELGEQDLLYVKEQNTVISEQSKAMKKMAQSKQQDAAEAIAQRSIALNEWVICKAVKAWNNPKWTRKFPCDREHLCAMSKGVKARLCDDIVAKSYSGRAASDGAENF